MDSAKLVEMVAFYQENHAGDQANSIDSITIIRNGYLVADIYLNPLYPKDSMHILHSWTKSIMSALIGIAIKQGISKVSMFRSLNSSKTKSLRSLTVEQQK